MNLSLASIFTDNMVLQQGMPIAVWGDVNPGVRVTVAFRGQCVSSEAASDLGKWKVVLDPMAASSEPASLLVFAKGDKGEECRLECQNILTGEVWVCSGQSNMEWPVALADDPETEIASADFPAIRLLYVPLRIARDPASDIANAEWVVCSPSSIRETSVEGYPFGFSATGYYFGRELYRQLGVPIGLIEAAVGSTCAEAWISREGLVRNPDLCQIYKRYENTMSCHAELQAAWERECAYIEAKTCDEKNIGEALGYADGQIPDDDWPEMRLPGNWFSNGLEFNGIVWFRKTVEIPENWRGRELRLALGAIDKSDVTYFNGEKVGCLMMRDSEDAWRIPRVYKVPARFVRAARIVITVRVHSNVYDAGIIGPSKWMELRCPSLSREAAIPLCGTWRYRVEANYGRITMPQKPFGPDNKNTPTALFNGMIAPLGSFAIRGVAWYQGEGNVARGEQYRSLFTALIEDWRRNWRSENLGFYFVQLANFGQVQDQPGESLWAELREAQRATLCLPETGMAVAIDIGEVDNIHPHNKQEVGRRLALRVLGGEYGIKSQTSSGPLFRECRREGNAIRLFFDHAENGLVCKGNKLEGFAIAGEDREFVWASAQIESASVLVSSPSVPFPGIIRYGWADNPVCNLYNTAMLPASPFEACV